jgi:hypothetical protein
MENKEVSKPVDSVEKDFGPEASNSDLDSVASHSVYCNNSIEQKPTTHETFVIGFNEADQVIFFKSYEYLKQKTEAQSDLKWVIDNCHHWEIGAADTWVLVHEDIAHEVIIPHP